MPAAVRQECSIFSIIALGLLFITQSLGLYMTMAHRLSPPKVALLAAVFFAAGLICASILSLLSTPLSAGRKGIFSPFPPLLALCIALLFAGHAMDSEDGILALALRTAGVGALWILALHAFFLFAPQRRKGLILGLAAAAGELIWIALLPAMNIIFSNAASPALSGHLHKLQMALQCASLLLLAAAFAFRPAQAGMSPAENQSGDSAGATVLPLLFFAAALFYSVYGLASGVVFPKVGHAGMPDGAHILLLITMPLAGAFFDRGGRGCRLLLAVLAMLAFTAPVTVFMSEKGVAREVLYALLCAGRQGVFLATLLLADRLLRNRERLPLLLVLAYTIPITSMAGRAVAHAETGFAVETGIALALALAFAFLTLRLQGVLSGLSLPEAEEAPRPEPGAPLAPDAARLAVFGFTYGLSRQETLVMEMLAQQRPTQDIATAMNVSEKTVRTYISRMLQKTKAPNRVALVALFAAPSPAPTEHGEHGSR